MSTPFEKSALERWRAKQAHYQSENVVHGYDAQRFRGLRARGSTARKWRAIERELGALLAPGARVLDVPCGRGRFTDNVLDAGFDLVSADLSGPMLHAASERGSGRAHFGGALRCDAAALPFRDASFDLVLSIRFLFHVPRELRPAYLRELGRVSRRFVVVDVRHVYCWTTHTKRLRAWIGSRRMPGERATLRELDLLVAASGLRLRKRLWIAPLLSEKMLLVCEKQ